MAQATVGSLVLEAAGRLERAGVAFGHGTANALDEAAWLVLRALGRPPGDVAPIARENVDATGARAARALVARRIRTRKPAAYLLNEAWLGPDRFYLDERVIVPRSFIAEMARERFAPWVKDPASVTTALDLCTGSGCLAILLARAFPKAKVDAAWCLRLRAGTTQPRSFMNARAVLTCDQGRPVPRCRSSRAKASLPSTSCATASYAASGQRCS